jgi:hypothetical protein
MADEDTKTDETRFKILAAIGRYRIKEEIHPGYWAWMTHDDAPFEPREFASPQAAEYYLDYYMANHAIDWTDYETLAYIGHTRTPHSASENLEGGDRGEHSGSSDENGSAGNQEDVPTCEVVEPGGSGGETL